MISSLGHKSAEAFEPFLEQNLRTDLLRFTTAGSVDDGKSTLIGRLLHDSKAVYEDQLASVKKSLINRSSGPIDFSLLTDGLRAEREQGITIDVAYRYFATPRRKFIIADTPGHEQYTRNMATGASTADLAVILIDAMKGLLPQTRRHAFISSLLGITKVLAAVNKMDLVGYREDAFLESQANFLALAAQLGIESVQCIPISALEGHNVVERSGRMPWYEGPTLLEHLETVPLPEKDSLQGFRFPVQTVIRPDATFRGFAGRIASGVIHPGNSVLALPSGQKTSVRSIVTFDGPLPRASSSMSVTLQLEDEIDLSRGDMLVSPDCRPSISRKFRAMVVWLHPTPLEVGRIYLVKHTVRQTKLRALRVQHRVDVNTLLREPASHLEMNEIGSVEFEAHVPLFFDPYSSNRTTGSFILIDPMTNATVGGGMIQEDASPARKDEENSREFLPQAVAENQVTAEQRFARHGHAPAVILLEGRPALAIRLERHLFELGCEVLHLRSPEFSSEMFAEVVRVAQSAGIIAIYSGQALAAQAKQRIAAEYGNRFLDLADAPELDGSDERVEARVLAFSRSLRLVTPLGDQERTN
ncbi:MAG TPA: sulfate adenylyltransferase subunit CysN [Candidatus Acidoferrum sp.]|nr:sulfate adenylyltransferase subunit CysN [Candidatus Acidoferrum sp.]